MGDRYDRERHRVARPVREGPTQQERLLELLEQARSIVRYLEVAGDHVYNAANQFYIETEFLTRDDEGNKDLEARETRFRNARSRLMTELKK